MAKTTTKLGAQDRVILVGAYVQAARDLGVHQSVLRNWVRASKPIRSIPFPATVR
jgi:hypothetical protein